LRLAYRRSPRAARTTRCHRMDVEEHDGDASSRDAAVLRDLGHRADRSLVHLLCATRAALASRSAGSFCGETGGGATWLLGGGDLALVASTVPRFAAAATGHRLRGVVLRDLRRRGVVVRPRPPPSTGVRPRLALRRRLLLRRMSPALAAVGNGADCAALGARAPPVRSPRHRVPGRQLGRSWRLVRFPQDAATDTRASSIAGGSSPGGAACSSRRRACPLRTLLALTGEEKCLLRTGLSGAASNGLNDPRRSVIVGV